MRIKLRILSLLSLVFLTTTALGQMSTAKWTYGFVQKEAKVGDVVELLIKGTPPGDFHIYSTKHGECITSGAPLKFALYFKENATFEVVGSPIPVGDKKKFDKVFECDVYKFDHVATFKQKVKILQKDYDIVTDLEAQMCTDETCVKLDEYDIKFSSLKITSGKATNVKEVEPVKVIKKDPVKDPKLVKEKDPKNTLVDEVVPENPIDTTSTEDSIVKEETSVAVASKTPSYKSDNGEKGECEAKTFDGKTSNDSENETYWGLFIVAFLSGLAALLTPCVFPMIPMTVSFFMKDKKNQTGGIKDGLIFGLSIVVIYTVIGTIVALVFGASFANWISTHWLPNTLFFIIFMIFAASFLGAFEITLPSWLVNKIDSKADKGGLMGTFFMAFTIVLVSFSCTGPIVGAILVESVQGGVMRPIIGMLGFGLAFALPFGLFAIFPQWLNNLPKSGGWLNTVKVVLGFLELALGLKFLSIADLTYHWGILDREVYLALWIIIFGLLGLYLLGKLKTAHDSDVPHIKVPRLLMGIGVLAFVVYLIPGMWGAPLKAISGYLPPMHTQDFNIERSIKEAAGVPEGLCSKPSYEGLLHVPLELSGYFDYDEAVACAKEQKKPLFIDFTGHGCANCRKFENLVWSDSKVLKLLRENFVIASLYVDDKKAKLPKDQQYVSRFNGRLITTLGDKNSDIEKCYFGANTQPLYAVMDGTENLVAPSRGTDFDGKSYDPEEFAKYLEDAIERFNKSNPKK